MIKKDLKQAVNKAEALTQAISDALCDRLDNAETEVISGNILSFLGPTFPLIAIDDIDICEKKIYGHFFGMPLLVESQIYITFDQSSELKWFISNEQPLADIAELQLEEEEEYVLIVSKGGDRIIIAKATDYFETVDDSEIL